jgi:UDP-GlcNAc:undecaprenyl-phosphate/decaprenyl-phosphate GlcNAc-1-phosphate transferase
MTVYLALLLTGVILSLLLTPLVSRVSMAFGLVDAPGGRKVHLASVPRLGGLAIAAAAWLTLVGVILLAPSMTGPLARTLAPIEPILIGGALVFAVGLADDLRPLPPWPKLAVQIAAAVLVMQSGLLIERITLGGDTVQLRGWAWPVTLVWIVGLTNAFNLIDGVDGLAAGVSVIAGATCTAILIARGHVPEAMLLAALVGSALGFLVYNFAPASIFLGDGGSLLFGFVLATTAITGWQKGATALAAGVPLLIFALPIADAGSALWRRVFRRDSAAPVSWRALLRRIVEPDRGHIHHRLLSLGLSTRYTVVLLYGLTLLLAGLALATARLG